jgi:hypothetical protein
MSSLVPDDFVLPHPLETATFRLEPLSVAHNESDHKAWTSSIEHIQSTPGFAGRPWPSGFVSSRQNEIALAAHQRDFQNRTGFTYTVLNPKTSEVIGCVYFYPPRAPEFDVDVRSWVRADLANLDGELYRLALRWLKESWPWTRPEYAQR